MKESTCQSDREHGQIRKLIETENRSFKRPMILPMVKLVTDEDEVSARNIIPLRQILTKQQALELKARKNGKVTARPMSRTGVSFFDQASNRPYDKDLDEYMEKRSSVLSSRYGD